MPLITDLFDMTAGELVEAKAISTRESIRRALGQVFDKVAALPQSVLVGKPAVGQNAARLQLADERPGRPVGTG